MLIIYLKCFIIKSLQIDHKLITYHGYISAKNNRLIFKYIKCNKKHKKHFNKDLIKRFENA